jgi:hypothetical protein
VRHKEVKCTGSPSEHAFGKKKKLARENFIESVGVFLNKTLGN